MISGLLHLLLTMIRYLCWCIINSADRF